MAMGKRRRHPKQTSMCVATQDLPRSAAHPFYTRLNQILDKADFDVYVESPSGRRAASSSGNRTVLRRIAALAENFRIVGHPEQCASWITILLAVLAVLDHVNYAVDFDDDVRPVGELRPW
jgi:hypothetical protein